MTGIGSRAGWGLAWALLMGLGQVLPAVGQAEIALFSRMVDAQEDIDTQEPIAKNFPSLEVLVKALRGYEGLADKKEYTIFVPNNDAFKRVPPTTLEYFTNPDNKRALDELISFHVIAQRLTRSELEQLITTSGGRATLKTISGFKVFALKDEKGTIILENESGKKINLTAFNWKKGQGTIHVVDSVIIPFDGGLIESELAQPNLSDDFVNPATQGAKGQ